MEIFLYPISLNLFDYLSRRFKWDCAVRAGENRRYGQFYGLLYYDCEYLRVYVFLFEFRTVALQHYSPGRSVRRHPMDETTPFGPRVLCLRVVWLASGGVVGTKAVRTTRAPDDLLEGGGAEDDLRTRPEVHFRNSNDKRKALSSRNTEVAAHYEFIIDPAYETEYDDLCDRTDSILRAKGVKDIIRHQKQAILPYSHKRYFNKIRENSQFALLLFVQHKFTIRIIYSPSKHTSIL